MVRRLAQENPGLEQVLVVGVAPGAQGDDMGGEGSALGTDHDRHQAVGGPQIGYLLHDPQRPVLQLHPACILTALS